MSTYSENSGSAADLDPLPVGIGGGSRRGSDSKDREEKFLRLRKLDKEI